MSLVSSRASVLLCSGRMVRPPFRPPPVRTLSLHDGVLRLERGLDLLLDAVELRVRNVSQLLVWVESQVAAEAEGLGATDAVQSVERELEKRKKKCRDGKASETPAPE